MRRRPDAPNGVMEYLVVALIHRFRAEGRRGMTLGLAPHANIDGEGIADRALRLLYDAGARIFIAIGAASLQGEMEPRSEARYARVPQRHWSFPRIAGALRELARSRSTSAPARGRCRSPGASLAPLSIGLVVCWIMAATRLDPSFHHVLERHLGLRSSTWGNCSWRSGCRADPDSSPASGGGLRCSRCRCRCRMAVGSLLAGRSSSSSCATGCRHS